MASRINYAQIKSRYNALGKAGVRLTQSDLYLTQEISASKTVYNFDLLETQNATLQANEIRLNLNDEFIVTEIAIGLEADVLVGGVVKGKKNLTYAPTEIDYNTANLLPVFDGALSISVNNIVYLDKFGSRRNEFVQRTEFQVPAGIGAGVATIPSFVGAKDGVISIEPMITLSGAKKNTIQLTLPSAAAQVTTIPLKDAAGAAYSLDIKRLFVRFRGLNAQNGASFQN